jgi:predicted Fe-S protein YdhL (DUF1289 family)
MQSLVAIADLTRRRIVELLAVCVRTTDDFQNWLKRTRSIWSRLLDALERELRAKDKANERKAKKKFPHEK